MARNREVRVSAKAQLDAKRFAALAQRPDIPKIMALRIRYLDWMERKFDWLMEQLELNIEGAVKDSEPRTRLIMSALDRIAPSLRENTQGPEAPTGNQAPVAQIKIYNVNRGTGAARKEAIEIQATKRAAIAVQAGNGQS